MVVRSPASEGGSGPIAGTTLLANLTGSPATPTGATRAQLAGVGLVPPSSWAEQMLLAIHSLGGPAANIVQPYEFDCKSLTKDFVTQAAVGTGRTGLVSDEDGGGIDFSTGTTNNSLQTLSIKDWNNGTGAFIPVFIKAPKTAAWAQFARVKIITPCTGAEAMIFCAFQDAAGTADIWAGIVGDAANFTKLGLWINGGGTTKQVTTQVLATGVVVNVGMVFTTTALVAFYGLDGLVPAACAPTMTDLTNFPTGPGGNMRMLVNNVGTGANRHFKTQNLAFFTPAMT